VELEAGSFRDRTGRIFYSGENVFRGLTDKLAILAGLASPTDGRDAYDAAWLKNAISRMKPAYRETAVLVLGQQLTHAEAAEILGLAEATVSWRMSEVRRLLSG